MDSGMPWRSARWWSIRAKPRSTKGRRRSCRAASSGVQRPADTSSSSWRSVWSSTGSLSCPCVNPPATSVAYLGPVGTFAEEALLTQPDYATATLVPLTTVTDALSTVANGKVDVGFVPIENAIEGTVNVTLDGLIFDYELRI